MGLGADGAVIALVAGVAVGSGWLPQAMDTTARASRRITKAMRTKWASVGRYRTWRTPSQLGMKTHLSTQPTAPDHQYENTPPRRSTSTGRVKPPPRASVIAGLGDGYTSHSGRIGMARRMVAAGAPNIRTLSSVGQIVRSASHVVLEPAKQFPLMHRQE